MSRNEQIIALRREGMTLAAIGTRFGITRQRVEQIIKLADRTIPVRNTRVREAVEAAHGQGLTDRQIAADLGMEATAVWRIREMLGLPRNPAKRGRPRLGEVR